MKKLLIILIWLIGISVNATTYYVSTTGDNGNNGSTGSPWRTVNYGIQQLSAGDILLVRDGIYTENFECTRSGTAVNRITIKSENKWGAVLKNASYVYVFVNTGDYVTIQDFEVTKGAAQIWVGIYTEGSYTTIDGNKVHEISALNSGSHGAAGINTHTGSHSIIRNNYVYDVGWEAAPDFLRGSQGIYVTTPYNEIYNNLVWNISGTGICTYHEPVDHNYIFNNTIFNCYTQGILIAAGEGTGLAVDYCEVRNNILYDITYSDSHYGAIGVWGVVGSHNIFTNNLLYNNGRDYTLYGYGTPVDDVLANPLFRDYQDDGTGDYALQSGSPAIDAGIDVGLAYEGSAPDIGYIEYEAQVPAVDPVVIITTSVFVGTTTATSGGNVTDDGGGTVTARGVCWSTSANPTTADSKTTDGSGAGAFVSLMNPLLPATTYHVRAYATNEAGTGYGADIEFTTTSDTGLSGDPVMLNGKILFKDGKIIIK